MQCSVLGLAPKFKRYTLSNPKQRKTELETSRCLESSLIHVHDFGVYLMMFFFIAITRLEDMSTVLAECERSYKETSCVNIAAPLQLSPF